MIRVLYVTVKADTFLWGPRAPYNKQSLPPSFPRSMVLVVLKRRGVKPFFFNDFVSCASWTGCQSLHEGVKSLTLQQRLDSKKHFEEKKQEGEGEWWGEKNRAGTKSKPTNGFEKKKIIDQDWYVRYTPRWHTSSLEMTEVKQRWDWLVLGWVTAMEQKERNNNFPSPSLLFCGVALKSANQSMLCYGGVFISETGDRATEMQTS